MTPTTYDAEHAEEQTHVDDASSELPLGWQIAGSVIALALAALAAWYLL